MTQLDIFSDSFPLQNAIAWSSKSDLLYIAFKNCEWIGDQSLAQYLKSIAEVKKHGSDSDGNIVIGLKNYPKWLLDGCKNYKASTAGSNHPINMVDWM